MIHKRILLTSSDEVGLLPGASLVIDPLVDTTQECLDEEFGGDPTLVRGSIHDISLTISIRSQVIIQGS